MIRPVFNLLLFSIAFSCVFSCANIGTLEGGDEDTQAPILDTLRSTPNEKLNFRPGEIELSFDEYIKLSNPAKEIVVSPPLSYPLETIQRGKSVKVKISEKEVLKENATYSINFGNAIADYNEGNKLSNFSYVFSTGDYIDSLKVSGTILDAFTKEPVEDVLVMLYDNLVDSIIYKERPFYFSRTDKGGKYDLKNIKNDSFQIFLLADKNQNYFFDLETESMGFMDSIIILNDSSANVFDLEIFPNRTEPRSLSTDAKESGIIKILCNQELEEIPTLRFSEDLNFDTGIKDDSLFIWYDTTALKQMNLYLFSDTIEIKPSQLKKGKAKNIEIDLNKSKLDVTPNKELTLVFNRPILEIDTSQVFLLDTAEINQAYILKTDSTDARILSVYSSWKAGIDYRLIFNDSTLISYNGIANDSLNLKLNIAQKEERGIINFKALELDSTKQYLIKLVDKKLNEYGTWTIKNVSESTIIAEDLMPIEYSYYLIEDLNRNGKWDTGDYNNKTQPEAVILKGIPKLKENWELEVPVKGTDLN